MKENMFTENRTEPITEKSTLTRERLFEIAKELINHLREVIGDTKETYTVLYTILTDCVGLTETEIEELTYGGITDDEESEDDE